MALVQIQNLSTWGKRRFFETSHCGNLPLRLSWGACMRVFFTIDGVEAMRQNDSQAPFIIHAERCSV